VHGVVHVDDDLHPHRSTAVCRRMIAPGLIPLPLQLVACSKVIISRYGWGHYRKIHTLPTAIAEVIAHGRSRLICALSCLLLLIAVMDVTCDTPVADVGLVRTAPEIFQPATARFLGPASRCDEGNTTVGGRWTASSGGPVAARRGTVPADLGV